MMPPVFFAPPENIGEDLIVLPRDESKHARQVLRLTPGAIVMVVDGLGSAWRGEISGGDAWSVTVLTHQQLRNVGEPSVRLTLAVGMSQVSKLDAIVQKGTELGVIRFVPVISEKSKVKLDDLARARSRVRRLERVALAAMKQCRRSYRPEIAEPLTFGEFLAESDSETLKLVFHPGDGARSVSDITMPASLRRVTALTGPEAGFSDDEIGRAQVAGYTVVSLGSRILRAETAAPTICALIMDRLGEFR